ncbi:MAG: lipoyl synthase [Candidatus Westeberhardia cardiocondylae]|nr:lipoyl synthase [Candidatus Westeberhardia cardiocondylae]
MLQKPSWIKIKISTNNTRVQRIKNIIRKNNLYSVCEEASCPNLFECFSHKSVAFMILGNVCTRKCVFCDVQYGRPNMIYPDVNEPRRLAKVICDMQLNYVVLTSVNRDDLHDGGAEHFTKCIKEIRFNNPYICVEVLVPDFRGRLTKALNFFNQEPPDVLNHNLESVPRLYHIIRPGANYENSLKLLKLFKKHNPRVLTKSGLMVGLGETNEEIIKVIQDLRECDVDMLTLGQYLQPSCHHFPVKRYVTIQEFDYIKGKALSMGFLYAECGPFVRSSYHAHVQTANIKLFKNINS